MSILLTESLRFFGNLSPNFLSEFVLSSPIVEIKNASRDDLGVLARRSIFSIGNGDVFLLILSLFFAILFSSFAVSKSRKILSLTCSSLLRLERVVFSSSSRIAMEEGSGLEL